MRPPPSSLAQMVILAVIPPGRTAASYLALKKGRLKGLLSCGNASRRVRFVVE
jgi:hypothetical protein